MITIVIPTYKRPQLLKRAIESALNQSYHNLTVLVVDNNSQDETKQVVQEYMDKDSRVSYIENNQSIGATANFSCGLNATKTSWISFCSDDDYLHPDFVSDCLKPFEVHPDIAFSGGGGCYVNEQGETKPFLGKRPPDGYYEKPRGYFAYVDSMFYLMFGGIIFKTEILMKFGFDTRLYTGLDEDLIGRCAACYPVFFLCSKNYYFFYQNPSSLSLHNDFTIQENDAHFIYNNLRILSWDRKDRDRLNEFFRIRFVKIFTIAFRHHLKNRDFDTAYLYAKKACWEKPTFQNLGWKAQALLFKIFPSFLKPYQILKTYETNIRRIFK